MFINIGKVYLRNVNLLVFNTIKLRKIQLTILPYHPTILT